MEKLEDRRLSQRGPLGRCSNFFSQWSVEVSTLAEFTLNNNPVCVMDMSIYHCINTCECEIV